MEKLKSQPLSIEYIAGVLDTNGSFYKYRDKYLYFKISLTDKILLPIILFLKEKYNISFHKHGKIYYATQSDSVKNLICFMKQYCSRKDYEVKE